MSDQRNRTVGIAVVALALLCTSVSFAQSAPGAAAEKDGTTAPVADTRGDIPAVTAPAGAKPGESETAEVVSQPAKERGPLTLPTLTGQTGLFRTTTAEVGVRNHFRVSLHGEGFVRDQFLAGGDQDQNSHVAGDLTVGYTPWEYLEVYGAWLSTSNANPLIKAYAPELINALGDFLIGAKGRLPVTNGLDVALDFNLRFLNGVSKASVNFDATNVWAGAVASFDFAKHVEKLPLRAHLNVGYQVDRSRNLIDLADYRPCTPPTGGTQPAEPTVCDNLHLVLDYAYGIYPSRVRIAFALDAPFRLAEKISLRPFVEYHADVATERDEYFETRAKNAADSGDPDARTIADALDGAVMQWITFGVRLTPITGLTLDLGADVGLASPGYAYGPPVVPWNIIFGLTYAYDPMPRVERRTKIVTLTREVVPPPVEGTVRGVVVDATTKKPVAGAVVHFAGRPGTGLVTTESGTFVSYPLKPGEVELEIGGEGYQPARAHAVVTAGAEATVEAALQPLPPLPGKLRGRITDEVGAAVPAVVKLEGTRTLEIAANPATGMFEGEVPPGSYVARIEADGYLARERSLNVQSNMQLVMDLSLPDKPKRSLVELLPDQIKVKRTIHFKRNGAQLDPNSTQLLDEVVDVLARNPQVKRVRIEGHTDNTGRLDKNMQLSKDRAKAVMDYLVAQGVSPARLESEGYGPTKPLVPNIGARNKAKNRRVDFRIVEQ